MAVSNRRGQFAFNLVSSNTRHSVKRIEFDIDEYVANNPNANQWKVGFHDRLGNANNGVVHGDQLLADPEISGFLNDAPKNQVGLEYNYKSKLVKNFVTMSGYVNIYQPNDFSSGDFTVYVEDELLPYAREPLH